MIRSIRHKGLKRLYEDDDLRGVPAEHVAKLLNILATLDASSTIAHMNLPGYRLHALQGGIERLLGGHCPCQLARHLPFRRTRRLRR
jgi:proteic killer suppression protein